MKLLGSTLLLALGTSTVLLSRAQDHPPVAAPVAAFAQHGILLVQGDGVCAIPATVEVTDDLLEYVLVLAHGAAHESLFRAGESDDLATLEIWAQTLNAALLALGLEPGENAEWIEKDPVPSEEELRAGVSAYDVRAPRGDGTYLYAAWREGDELFFYRVEDLVRDLERGRTMRRHRWVYLGSRTITRSSDGAQAFAAAIEGNLVNVSFFAQGNTLFTGALAECLNQTTWLPNAWLLPPSGSKVLLVFAKERMDRPPASLAEYVPVVDANGGGPR